MKSTPNFAEEPNWYRQLQHTHHNQLEQKYYIHKYKLELQ